MLYYDLRAKQLYKYDGSACVIDIKGKQKENNTKIAINLLINFIWI